MNNLMTKSFLSYQDLKKEALKDLESGTTAAAAADLDLRSSIEMATSAHDDNLRLFFEEANLIQDEMSSIRDLLLSLQTLNEQSKSLHKPQPLKSLRLQINHSILLVLKKAKSIRDRLESMDRATATQRRLSGFRAGTPIDRTRTSITNALRKKLKELMLEFQELRQRMMAEHKEAVERRYFTVTGRVPEEEVIERMIAEGEGEEMMRKAMAEHGRGKVMETVAEIKDRYDGAKEVEMSLLELHQVFLDMAVMVEVQGERMDDIEEHVMNAKNYVKDGSKELGMAKGYQRRSRKWMWIGIVLLLILIMVVVVPIAASFRGRS